MSMKHLSDDDIQSYLDNSKSDVETKYHIETCEECNNSFAAYELLYGSLSSDYDIELSENFVSNTMQIIRDDAALNESSASVYLFSISGAIIGLLSIGYFFGFQTIFQYLGLTTITQSVLSVDIFQNFTAMIAKNSTLWNTLGFAAVILLFFSLIEKILDKTKFGRLHIFSI